MVKFVYPKDFSRAIVHTVGMSTLLKGLIAHLNEELEDKHELYIEQLRDNLAHTLAVYEKRYNPDDGVLM